LRNDGIFGYGWLYWNAKSTENTPKKRKKQQRTKNQHMFDPSMSALPIIVKQNSPSVG